jgi:hypothetical protein
MKERQTKTQEQIKKPAPQRSNVTSFIEDIIHSDEEEK